MADTKITGLAVATTLAMTDVNLVVDNVITTPITKQMTFANFIKAMGGTSFPASPVGGDRFYRSDWNLDCYYDGARWLTCQEYSIVCSVDTVFSADGGKVIAPLRADHAVYFTHVVCRTNTAAVNDGSKYWTVTIRGINVAYGASSSIDVFTTAADTAATYTAHDHAPSITTTPDNCAWVDVYVAKTSTPGNLTFNATIYYRLIVA